MKEEKTKIDDSEMLLKFELFEKFVKHPSSLSEVEKKKLTAMGVNL